ncbi:MAG: hypothetical protein AAF772_17540 [Acidobacteriota bacterium]
MSLVRLALALLLLLTPSLLEAGEPRPLPADFTAPALVARSGLDNGFRLPADVDFVSVSDRLDLRADDQLGFTYLDPSPYPDALRTGIWRGDASSGRTVFQLTQPIDGSVMIEAATVDDSRWAFSTQAFDASTNRLFGFDLTRSPLEVHTLLERDAPVRGRDSLQIDARGVLAYRFVTDPPADDWQFGWTSLRRGREVTHLATRPFRFGAGVDLSEPPASVGTPTLMPAAIDDPTIWLLGTATWSTDLGAPAARVLRIADTGETQVLIENQTLDPGSPYLGFSRRVVAASSGAATLLATRVDQQVVLLRIDPDGTLTELLDGREPGVGPLFDAARIAVNAAGWAAIIAFEENNQNEALFITDGVRTLRVAGEGDVVATDRGPARICVDGRITTFFGDLALNDRGTVAFSARLCPLPGTDDPGTRVHKLGFGIFTVQPQP